MIVWSLLGTCSVCCSVRCSIFRNRSPDAGPRRKRRHDDDGERSDERERNCGGWLDSGERRGVRDDQSSYAEGLDNGLEDLSNNPAELQRRCTAHIALSENQVRQSPFSGLYNFNKII